jgi:hypothetical protein
MRNGAIVEVSVMTPKKTPRGAAMTTMKGPSMRYRWAARVIPPVQFTRGEWRVVHALINCADENGEFNGGRSKLEAEAGVAHSVVSDALGKLRRGRTHSGTTEPTAAQRQVRYPVAHASR